MENVLVRLSCPVSAACMYTWLGGNGGFPELKSNHCYLNQCTLQEILIKEYRWKQQGKREGGVCVKGGVSIETIVPFCNLSTLLLMESTFGCENTQNVWR